MINPQFLRKFQFSDEIDNKETLYKKIDQIRKALELNKQNTKNLSKIIINNNIANVVYEDIGNFNGVLDKKLNAKAVILVNSKSNNQLFILAHEVIHLFLTPIDAAFSCYNKKEYQESNYEEWRANEGAAELLLPYKEFIPDYAYLSLYKNRKDCIQDLSDVYGVSKSVVNFRIKNLKDEILQYLSGIEINDIKIKN